ncbi:MAG: transposase, partial [Desulfovibrio sp.]|nr:transposase [Desulfovibrio sp.]
WTNNPYLEYDRFVGSFLSDSGSRFFPKRPGCGECTKPACRAGPHAAHVARGQRPEFTSNALKIWAEKNGITINYTRPGKPTDNGQIESFNGRLREECLNQHIFTSLEEAQEKIELWRQDYNQARPHGSLGWLTPAAYREKNTNPSPEPNLITV